MKKFDTVEEQKAFDSGVAYANAYMQFCITSYPFAMNTMTTACINSLVASCLNSFQERNFAIDQQNSMTFEEFCEKYPMEK